VYLVGAGPGDPGLITLRGWQCLARADAVVYDYLVNPRILGHARLDAQLICLGRHGRDRIMPQAEVCRRLVQLAREGKSVVRLKGGDPAVFAHAAEETSALEAAQIPYAIVPGISAALAVGSYAGIPLTHGETSSAVALVAGQERGGKPTPGLDYHALAVFPGTLVFYMGITTAAHWTTALISAGKSAHTPVAIVRRCSWPDQETIYCPLGDVPGEIESRRIRPPALVIVGPVAALTARHGWFVERPLFGVRVLVTRAEHQAPALTAALAELGAQVFEQPALKISPPDDWQPVDQALERLDQFDWLVFSSANGVRFLLDRLLEHRDVRALGKLRLAAVITCGPTSCPTNFAPSRWPTPCVPRRSQASDSFWPAPVAGEKCWPTNCWRRAARSIRSSCTQVATSPNWIRRSRPCWAKGRSIGSRLPVRPLPVRWPRSWDRRWRKANWRPSAPSRRQP
jgi:uroporphyrinogen III methyltransferase/synthase